MKYLLLTFSLLMMVSVSQAQFKTNAKPNCTCVGGTPTISAPGGVVATTTTIAIQWSSSFAYQWHIMAWDETVNGDIFEATATMTQNTNPTRAATISGLTPGHSYAVYISGARTCSDADGLCNPVDGSSISGTTHGLLTIPAAPSPSLSSLTATSFHLSWSDTGGTSYNIDVARDAGFTDLVVNGASVAALQYDATSLTPGTKYYYRVRAFHNPYTSDNSTANNITTLPNVPTMSALTNVATTSFNMNWQAATGAASYQIDVATDNQFTNIITGYNGLSVTGTTKSITGLSAGTTYFYRIRSVNSAGGVSANATFSQQLTFPDAPVFLPASNITTTSFIVSNKGTKSATKYQLDIALDGQFNSIFNSYNSIDLNSTTITIGFASPGTVYYVRERAVNATGVSASSDVLQVTTITSPTVATAATSVGPNGFTANWNAVATATSYSIDVATDQGMTNILSGYSNLTVNDIQQSITGLQTGSTYFYQVRVNNNGGTSINSNVISQLTLPAAPTDLAVSDLTSTTMKASWKAVPTATEYDIEVSTTLAFDNIVTGYNPKVVSNAITEAVLNENLLPSTVYYLRVRAKNPSGFSANSETRTASTLTESGGDNFNISLTDVNLPAAVTLGSTSGITFNVSGGIGDLQGTYYHRKKSESDFQSQTITVAKGANSIVLDDKWFDEIGMECYVEVKDNSGHLQRSTSRSALIHFQDVSVPVATFGKDVSNYYIISVPYDLATKKMSDVFEPIAGLGSYDETHWRLVHYKDGKNQDYRDGLSVSNIERGQGYWFISKDNVALSMGSANTFDNSIDQPFKLPLKKGWNQIGNPVGHNIIWSEMMALPANVNAPVGKLLVYANENISLKESDQLKLFSGGFVFADSDTELTFPVTLSTATGRVQQSNDEEDLQAGDWMLPIQLIQDRLVSDLSGIGMHHSASNEKDKLDMPVPPTLARFVNFSSGHQFSRDVVKPQDSYAWNFKLTSDNKNPVTLKWDRSSAQQLVLHDLQNNKLISMSATDSYVANPSSSFVIYFDRNKNLGETEVALGLPYPNPFNDIISFDFDYEQSNATLIITDMNGSELARGSVNGNKIQFNGKNLAPGLYIYRLTNGTSFYTGKIIKQ